VQPIFVGDVQGCGDELGELVRRATARFGSGFELWLVGDLINRGPTNLDLLRRVREWVERGRCRFVLGNHELALLRAAWRLREPQPLDTFQDVLGDSELGDWIEWLRRRPLVEAGLLGERRFVMVHAAVAPHWGLEEVLARARAVEARLGADDGDRARALLAAEPADNREADDLARFTRCRTAARDGRWSAREPRRREEAWHGAWAARRHGYGIVYGHFATQGLHVAPDLRGLDTGCVHQGWGRDTALTAWLPDLGRADPFAVPDAGFWQAPARRRYYDERGPIAEPARAARRA
jgi:bis(5'-nucleosyl)-tetraphosphatase (symmetrical)